MGAGKLSHIEAENPHPGLPFDLAQDKLPREKEGIGQASGGLPPKKWTPE